MFREWVKFRSCIAQSTVLCTYYINLYLNHVCIPTEKFSDILKNIKIDCIADLCK